MYICIMYKHMFVRCQFSLVSIVSSRLLERLLMCGYDCNFNNLRVNHFASNSSNCLFKL